MNAIHGYTRTVMETARDVLTPKARAALLRAHEKTLSYGVRALVSPAPALRLVIVLGEAHLKLGPASRLGKDVVENIALRGVETFQSKEVFSGKALRWLIYLPRIALRLVTLGLVKDSTIVDAKQASHGFTVEIERAKSMPTSLHVAATYMTVMFGMMFAQLALGIANFVIPGIIALFGWLVFAVMVLQAHMALLIPALILRRHKWSWLIHPLTAILTARDTLMADGTVRMLEDHPDAGPALVILGRAHMPGYERELTERYGFRRVSFP